MTAHAEDITDGGKGRGTLDMEIRVVFEERTIPIAIDGCSFGLHTDLYAGGTTVANERFHVNNVDGTECTADYEVTLTDIAPSGWIIRKFAEADITPFIGFDLPAGPAWYSIIFYTTDVGRPGDHDCTRPEAEGPYDIVTPSIGRIPIDVEQWDTEMRALSADDQVMTGSYQRQFVTGDDVVDQTAEWHIIREAP